MRRRQVGVSGLEVSRVGLGTMTWGDTTDVTRATAQLRLFVEAGGTFVDTSDGRSGAAAQAVLGT